MMLRLLLAALLLSSGACAAKVTLLPETASANQPLIRQLDVGHGTNAFLVLGARPILVDTGGASTEKLEAALAALGVMPTQLSLIVLTHGHADHAGGARRMHELSGAPVLAQEGDVSMLQAGHNGPLHATSLLAHALRNPSAQPFPAFTPELTFADSFSLTPYGVSGVVMAMPGHTPGSVAVVLPGNVAIVGDLLRGGSIRASAPRRHFFHDDCRAAEAHIRELVNFGVRHFYVGHGGPLDALEALDKLGGTSCPTP